METNHIFKATNRREETLDPEDWQAFAEVGRQMLNDMLAYLETVREHPIWQPFPERAKQALQTPLPTAGQPVQAVYDLWNYNDPAATAIKFRNILPQAKISGEVGYTIELLTQIARTEGLQEPRMKRGFIPCYGPHQMIMESKPWFAEGIRASSGLHYYPLS